MLKRNCVRCFSRYLTKTCRTPKARKVTHLVVFFNPLKKTLWPLFMDGVQLFQGQNHFEEEVYFITLSPQKFLVFILSTSEGRKTESTLEPPNRFDHETPGLGIQHLNHQAIGVNPQFSKMLDRKKKNNTVCSSINSRSNLVNNVFASVHHLGFNIKLLLFFT